MSETSNTITPGSATGAAPKRPSYSRRNRVHRAKSEMEPRTRDARESQRKRRGSLDGSSKSNTKESTGRGRDSRHHRTCPVNRRRHLRSSRSEKGERRFHRSRIHSDIDPTIAEHKNQPLRSQTVRDIKTTARKHQRAASSSEVTLDSLVKGIQMASSVHYSHRVRANLHSSFHGLDSTPRLPGSSRRISSRLNDSNTGTRRQRHREPKRRSKNETDESIRLLQFDCEKADGLNVVDTNIRVMGDSATSFTESITGETDSLGNSISSSPSCEEDQRLMWNPSEDCMEEGAQEEGEKNESESQKIGKNKNKGALRRVSKMLTSPLTKRLTLAKNMEELLDLSDHTRGSAL